MKNFMKKSISIFLLVCLISAQFSFFIAKGNAQVLSSVVEYLKSETQSDWSAMAFSAMGIDVPNSSFLKKLDGQEASDIATYILAITSMNKDPRTFGEEDLIKKLKSTFSAGQFGNPSYLSDDMFSILALRSAGVSADDQAIVSALSFIKNNQKSDGSWSWNTSDNQGSVDYTAMGIMTLMSCSVSTSDTIVSKASGYLLLAQNQDGGFPISPKSESNTPSTAWALSAIHSMSDNQDFWAPSSKTPSDYLKDRLSQSGYFLFDKNSNSKDAFTSVFTSYAAIALSGKFYPIKYIQGPVSVSVRIEGSSDTVCKAEGIEAKTALDALKTSSEQCGFSYEAKDTQYGTYVSKIGNDAASGSKGWSYLVNYKSPSVGAAEYSLSQKDELVWYYGEWDDSALKISSATSAKIGDKAQITVEELSGGSWVPKDGASVKIGNKELKTDNSGKVEFFWETAGDFYVYAFSEGSIRSDKVLVFVSSNSVASGGASSDNSKSIEMSVDVIASSQKISTLSSDLSSAIVFGVSGDLNFGQVEHGKSSSKKITITNSGSGAISLTATVSGSDLFLNNLSVDSSALSAWKKTINPYSWSQSNVSISIPSSYSKTGQEKGVLIFWARKID